MDRIAFSISSIIHSYLLGNGSVSDHSFAEHTMSVSRGYDV